MPLTHSHNCWITVWFLYFSTPLESHFSLGLCSKLCKFFLFKKTKHIWNIWAVDQSKKGVTEPRESISEPITDQVTEPKTWDRTLEEKRTRVFLLVVTTVKQLPGLVEVMPMMMEEGSAGVLPHRRTSLCFPVRSGVVNRGRLTLQQQNKLLLSCFSAGEHLLSLWWSYEELLRTKKRMIYWHEWVYRLLLYAMMGDDVYFFSELLKSLPV